MIIMQIPQTADAGSLPLFHGDSVPLCLKASPAGGRSSTRDLFFNDDVEDETRKLQLTVCNNVYQWLWLL